jgi:ribonuclease HI
MPQEPNPKHKYYAVAIGRRCGIFDDWETAKKQVDGHSGNLYQGYTTE